MVADMALAATAFSVANSLGASPKVMLSLFEAGLVESGFRNLDYGDRDSLGYLQQRPSQGWPDPRNVTTATKSYVTRAMDNDKKHPNYTAGQLAQSVQRSAFPDRYDKREKEARALIAQVNNGSSSGMGPAPGKAGKAGGPLGQDGGGLVDAINDAAGALGTMATGAVNVGGLATQLAKLALPSNVVRVAAGGLGVILIFAGILIIGREIK
jgi:hypothetical protein